MGHAPSEVDFSLVSSLRATFCAARRQNRCEAGERKIERLEVLKEALRISGIKPWRKNL